MKSLLASLALCLLVAFPAFAQNKSPNAPNVKTDALPLTEVERLKLENAALVQQLAGYVQEVAQWRQMFAQASARLGEFEVNAQQEASKAVRERVVKEIEDARPGFKFNPHDGSFKPKEQ